MDAGHPTPHATYPEARAGRPLTLPYLVLHRVGFAELPRSPGELVRSYRTVSPLPGLKPDGSRPGGILSVALSFVLPRLHVMKHPALWCSDFPPGLQQTRRSFGLLRPRIRFLPIYNPIAARAISQLIVSLQFIVNLRGNIHIAALTDGIENASNRHVVDLLGLDPVEYIEQSPI